MKKSNRTCHDVVPDDDFWNEIGTVISNSEDMRRLFNGKTIDICLQPDGKRRYERRFEFYDPNIPINNPQSITHLMAPVMKSLENFTHSDNIDNSDVGSIK